MMPVSKMQEKVTTDEELRQIKLGDFGEYLGLVPVRTPLPGCATPPTDAEVGKPCIDTPLHTAAGGACTRGSDNPLTPPG
jgi:hypothetical protein